MKFMRTRRAFLFTGIALLIFSAFLFYERNTPRRLSFAIDATHISKSNVESPIAVLIPSLSISLPIFPATIKQGVWDTTDKGVSYLTSSPVPGEKGNSILYAHNWPNLFGKLPSMKPGDTVTVIGKKNTVQTFHVTYTGEIDPTNKSILAPSDDTRITLYTCSGFFDTKRFVVVATL